MKYFYLVLMVILILVAFAVVVMGFSSAQGAPQEAVVVGLACFFGILARIAQAAAHNAE